MSTSSAQALEFFRETLSRVYSDAYITEWGTVYASAPSSPVVCRLNESARGPLIVAVESPVLIDVPEDPALYQTISMLQHRQEFGGIFVAGGAQPDLIMIAVHAHLLVDGLGPGQLLVAADLVNHQAIDLIDLLESITPPVGGRRAYT